MDKFNYKHLKYFYAVARSGSLQSACDLLHITPQTISGQIKQLEDAIGYTLFEKQGRNLTVTSSGKVVYDYCERIFGLGQELEQLLLAGLSSKLQEFQVGVVDVVPKSISQRLLEPVLQGNSITKLICHEQHLDNLLAELAIHRLDFILSDSPVPTTVNVRAYSHLLGRSQMACFAPKSLYLENEHIAMQLHQAPLIMPGKSSALHSSIASWLGQHNIQPRIVAEIDDTALTKAFASNGHGFFFAPQVLTEEFETNYDVLSLGVVPGLYQNYYGISTERQINHPGVKLILQSAQNLFGTDLELN